MVYIFYIGTKSILTEVFHATIYYFATYLARSKCSWRDTNIIMKVAGANVNKTFWSVGQKDV